jgi:hypothetical protein
VFHPFPAPLATAVLSSRETSPFDGTIPEASINFPRTRALAASAALLVLTLAACTSTTPIKTLLSDPSNYDHKTVAIAGTVKTAVGVLGYGAYQVDDGTGSLIVLTKAGGAPKEGAQVGVTGEFRAGFTLGTETGAVLIEKEHKLK